MADSESVPPAPTQVHPAWSLSAVTRASRTQFLRWAALTAASVTFLALSRDVVAGATAWLDAPISSLVERMRSESLTPAARAVTTLGNAEVLTAIALMGTLGLWVARRTEAARYLGLTAAGAGILNASLKQAIARPRPVELARLSEASGFAFPSGHAMASAAILGAITLLAMRRYPERRVPLVAVCALLVVLIGMSRVYLGVHYPSDVLAGWALGFVWAMGLERGLLRG